MSRNLIKLPNRCRDPYFFEEILCMQDSIYNADGLDCSQLTFIEPYSMLSLLLMGRNYLRLTGNKLKLVSLPINIHQYLARMDFLKYMKHYRKTIF
jgi:hypothetical protein